MPYKARTITGAERRVNQLMRQIAEYERICQRLDAELVVLAKLAAEGPAFSNPLHAWEAKKVRDRILRAKCRLNPDGSFIN